MAIDMKEIIAAGAGRLLLDKKVKKLTVKDIVEECNISRQTFYYHFEDIPGLLKWKLETEFDKMLQECMAQDDLERGMHYVFSVVINMQPHVERGLQTNYGEDFEKLLKEFAYRFFRQLIEEKELYKGHSLFEKELIIRYHCNAMAGIGREWTNEDTQNMEEIVHFLYSLVMGEVHSI